MDSGDTMNPREVMTSEKWQEMTAEEKQSLVAKCCGFTLPLFNEIDELHPTIGGHKMKIRGWRDGMKEDVPDYLNDLNAMYKAVSTLTADQLLKYGDILCDVVGPYWDDNGHIENIWCIAEASAADRAEAFVLTIEGEEEFEL